MKQDRSHLTYICPKSIYWVKDSNQIIVVDSQANKTQILTSLEVTIWGLLTLSYSYPNIVRFLSALLSLPVDKAERVLVKTLDDWRRVDLLRIEDQSANG